jgi:hypothetical protein
MKNNNFQTHQFSNKGIYYGENINYPTYTKNSWTGSNNNPFENSKTNYNPHLTNQTLCNNYNSYKSNNQDQDVNLKSPIRNSMT